MAASFTDPSASTSLKLSQAEARKLLDALNRRGGGAPTNRTRRLRVPYESPNVIIECDDGSGRTSRFRVLARNISTHGIAVVHGQFMHVRRPCVVEMPTLDAGATIRVTARIERCRLVGGRVHEIALVFTQPIDLSLFVELDAATEMRVRTELQSDVPESKGRAKPSGSAISGKALIVEDFESNRKLYSFWLSKLGLSIHETTDLKPSLELISKHRFEVMLIDEHLAGGSGTELIKQIRASGATGMIIAISAEATDALRDACLLGGADLFLAKPFDRDALQRAIIERLLADKHGVQQKDPIRSTMAADAEMQPLIQNFLSGLKTLREQLDAACRGGDMGKLQSLVANLAESGRGYGFAPLSEVGEATVRMLHSPNLKALDIRRGIERMMSVIGRCAA